jgi:RND family efflux transporter MFP subunit
VSKQNELNTGRLKWVIALLVLIVFIGIGIRYWHNLRLARYTKALSVLHVNVISPKRSTGYEEVMLPGTLQGWHDAPLFARTNGYVTQWLVDIGSVVKKGQLLANISTPEVNAQLRQAEAEVGVAKNNNDLAQITAARWKILVVRGVVSKQDADDKIQTAAATLNSLKAAIANCERLTKLVGFERIIAPFDGVITARTTDVGNLINQGSIAQQAIFHITQTNFLRLYVSVPQEYTNRIWPNMLVTLRFIQFPNFYYKSTLVRSAKSIDPATLTMLTQFIINNKDQKLLAGSYTKVYLQLPKDPNIFILPINAILFRAEGLPVATVTPNNEILLKPIRLGRDFGTQVEVVAGIKANDRIITSPPDGAYNGQKVVPEQLK